jgi:hypothetical protein
VAVLAVAWSTDTTGPTNTHWRIFYGLRATSKFWDINQLDASTGNIGQFPINAS